MSAITNIRTVSCPSLGKLPLAEKPGTFTPSGKKREHKPGRLAEDGGYTESESPAKLELNLNLTRARTWWTSTAWACRRAASSST